MKNFIYLTAVALFLSCFTVKAQTVDATDVFTPALYGTEIVHANIVYNLNEDVSGRTNRDANFTLSNAEMTTWSNGACIATFGTSGIQARNGGGNASMNVVQFADGDEIDLWFMLNFMNHTYTLYARNVTAAGAITLVYKDAAFRTEQNAITQIERWSAVHNSGNSDNTLTVNSVSVVDYVGNPTIADITSISLNIGEMTFDPAVLTYNVELPKGTDTVIVAATASQPCATIGGDGAIDVRSGSASTIVYATSANGQNHSPEYRLNFTVKNLSQIATLKSIKVTLDGQESNLSGFTSTGYDYTYSVPVTATGIPTISGEVTDATATITSTTQATAVPGVATIVVTAEDGETQSTYTVRFIKNLLAGWDGNGATGEGSSPDNFGWTTPNNNFQNANGGSGSRYMDYGNGQYSASYEYTYNGANFRSSRLLWLRWNNSTSYYTLAVNNLESCKTYRMTFKYAWHNNGSQPTVKVGIHEKSTGVLKENTTDFLCSETKREFTEGSFTFTTTTLADGQYYLSFGVSANNTGDVMVAVTNLVLEEVTNPETEMFITKSQMLISDLTPENLQSFFVNTVALAQPLELTAPAGIMLSANGQVGSTISIPATEATCGVNVKATATNNYENISGYIMATAGELTDSIRIIYVAQNPTNLLSLAMGAGADVDGEGTEPSSFGWYGASYINQDEPKVATFTTAGAGTNRYNSVVNYRNFGEFDTIPTDWALMLRWDGTGNTDSATVYNYPVELQEGKHYVLTGKYAWHNNGEWAIFTFGMNSERDNSGVEMIEIENYAAEYSNPDDRGQWYHIGFPTDERIEFTATASGVHYFNIYMYPEYINESTQILATFKDFSLICTDCETSIHTQNADNVRVFVQNKQIVVEGADNFKVYSATGAQVNAKAAQLTGVYVVSVNGNQYKVVVK